MPQRRTNIEDLPIRRISPDIEPDHTTSGIKEMFKHRSLLKDFVSHDIRERYTGGSFGFFWAFITPFIELMTYTFVFHGLIGVNFSQSGDWQNYALFLFCGMVCWQGLADGVSHATTSVSQYGHLIKKVRFPSILLPSFHIVSATINQSIRFVVLIGIALLLGEGISWHIVLVPLVMLTQFFLTLGIGLLMSVSQVYLRDTNHWLNAFLLMWMFITPIFYPASSYPVKYMLLLQLNPLAHLVGVYRELILNHTLPHPNSIVILVVISMFIFVVGQSVFHHHKSHFSDYI
jgi:lipopolysaccharide transport system permease protein